MDVTSPKFSPQVTQPRLLEQSQALVSILKKYSAEDIKTLMKVSNKIAELNVERFQNFSAPFTSKNATPALFAFKGDVYDGLDAVSMDDSALSFAHTHVRMLSGLYGLLRPMDLMQAYRLEMGRNLDTEQGKNLYAFWGEQIAALINSDAKAAKASHIINLASQEYSKAAPEKWLEKPMITVHFKEKKGSEYKVVGLFAKKARGMMTRYLCDEQITEPGGMMGFDRDGYAYAETLSDEKNMVFTRG